MVVLKLLVYVVNCAKTVRDADDGVDAHIELKARLRRKVHRLDGLADEHELEHY